VQNSIKRELRHLYGVAILLFYYIKIPVLIGVPILYFYLNYKRSLFLDILWLWCAFLIIKDIAVMIKRYIKGEKVWR
jgi:hypothetical protein